MNRLNWLDEVIKATRWGKNGVPKYEDVDRILTEATKRTLKNLNR